MDIINSSSPFHFGFGSAFKNASAPFKSANSTKTDPLNSFVLSILRMRTALVGPYALKKFSSCRCRFGGSSVPNHPQKMTQLWRTRSSSRTSRASALWSANSSGPPPHSSSMHLTSRLQWSITYLSTPRDSRTSHKVSRVIRCEPPYLSAPAAH